MIRGRVERNQEGGLEAWISILVRDSDGEFRQRDVILDTGFTGCLMLPEDDVRDLGLIISGSRQGIMASGNEESFAFYGAWVMWNGDTHEVGVLQSIDQPLLGMELLEGCHIAVDAWDGGAVTVTFP